MVASTGVFTAASFAFLAIGAALPVLPTFVRGPLHAGDVWVGVVVGAFALTAVVARPLAGRAADRRGRRIVLIVGSLVMALGGLMYLASDSVAALIAARLVVGAGEGAVYTAGAAWAVDLAPDDKHGLALGMFGLAVWGGLSLGPVIGEVLRSEAGFDAVWTLTAALPLAAAVIATRLREPLRAMPEAHAENLAWFPRAARRPGVALALANVGYAALAGFGVLLLRARGIGGGASMFSAFAVAVFASRIVLGRMPDRAGAQATATAAGVLEALGLTIIALAGSLAVALVGAVVVGLGFSMLFPSLALMVVGDVGEQRRASALGAFTAFFDIGVGLGAPLAGAIAAAAGYTAVFAVAAVAAACTAVLAATRGGALSSQRAASSAS
jgi:MFS family permease